jgi:hypothetical protein
MRPERRGRRRAARVGAAIAFGMGGAGALAWALVPAGAATRRAAPRQVGLPPAVATQPADRVHATSAVLHASVDPNGLPTTYRFEYGRTTAYGSATPRMSAGGGTVPAEVEARIDGLRPGATYHFRADATNAAGTTQGLDSTFTTREPRLAGRYVLRLRIKGAGGVFGHRKGDVVRRVYKFDPSCSGSRCPRVHLVRRGQRGHFRSTLKRAGPGVYRGVERFRRGVCDDGLRFHSRAPIKVVVKRLRDDRASRIKGKLKVLVAGCAHGRERAPFRGRLKG